VNRRLFDAPREGTGYRSSATTVTMAITADSFREFALSGAKNMNPNGERLEPPDLSHFHENISKFPPEEYFKYAGKCVAYSPDGLRIVASGDSWEELFADLDAKGIDGSQVVSAFLDPPGVSCI
jgi:hypothetical protein